MANRNVKVELKHALKSGEVHLAQGNETRHNKILGNVQEGRKKGRKKERQIGR